MIRAPDSLIVVRSHAAALTRLATDLKQKIAYEPKSFNEKTYQMPEITGAQIRAARALLRWTAERLADSARVGLSTVRRAEAEDGAPPITDANLTMIQITLEKAGIEFIPMNGGGVGVRFRKA